MWQILLVSGNRDFRKLSGVLCFYFRSFYHSVNISNITISQTKNHTERAYLLKKKFFLKIYVIIYIFIIRKFSCHIELNRRTSFGFLFYESIIIFFLDFRCFDK